MVSHSKGQNFIKIGRGRPLFILVENTVYRLVKHVTLSMFIVSQNFGGQHCQALLNKVVSAFLLNDREYVGLWCRQNCYSVYNQGDPPAERETARSQFRCFLQ